MDYVLTFRAEARDEMEDAYNWYEDQKQYHNSVLLSRSIRRSVR